MSTVLLSLLLFVVDSLLILAGWVSFAKAVKLRVEDIGVGVDDVVFELIHKSNTQVLRMTLTQVR